MKATDTGFGVSAARAMGMLYPEEKRLYNDPISEKLLTGGNKFFVKLMHISLVLKLFYYFHWLFFPGSTRLFPRFQRL